MMTLTTQYQTILYYNGMDIDSFTYQRDLSEFCDSQFKMFLIDNHNSTLPLDAVTAIKLCKSKSTMKLADLENVDYKTFEAALAQFPYHIRYVPSGKLLKFTSDADKIQFQLLL